MIFFILNNSKFYNHVKLLLECEPQKKELVKTISLSSRDGNCYPALDQISRRTRPSYSSFFLIHSEINLAFLKLLKMCIRIYL